MLRIVPVVLLLVHADNFLRAALGQFTKYQHLLRAVVLLVEGARIKVNAVVVENIWMVNFLKTIQDLYRLRKILELLVILRDYLAGCDVLLLACVHE